MTQTLSVPQGQFPLMRHPVRPNDQLRAWDAADEYVLEHLVGDAGEAIDLHGSIVIVNDAFGALTTALAPFGPLLITDSENGRLAAEDNANHNSLDVPQRQSPFEPVAAPIDVLVVKIPKSEGELVDILHRLRPSLHAASVVIAAGMTKRVHQSTIAAFESIIGPTTSSLARKKARLLFSRVDPDLVPPANPWPRTWNYGGLTLTNHAGVFSAERIDPGTELLVTNLPDEAATGDVVVDLGCGNGLLGQAWAKRHPDATVTFVDESYRALRSAEHSWETNFGDRPATFVAVDRLVNAVARDSVDLVLNNPPFHADRSRSDVIAWDMFVDAFAVLRPGGELFVVGNRHLGYHAKLKKIFGNSEVVASTKKFVVLRSQRH
jgi:23S rRNA (guanine1835-N2)-methyltransferase